MKFYCNLKMSAKFILSFAIMVILLVSIGVLGIYSIHKTDRDYTKMYEVYGRLHNIGYNSLEGFIV